MRLPQLLLIPMLLVACGPPMLKGDADLRLRDLVLSKSASAEQIAPLLATDATVYRAAGTAHGAQAGAKALAEVKPDGQTRIYRHHDVSLLVLGDGRVLLMQRGEEDHVTRAVELRAPTPGDGFPIQAIYYDRSWNADDARARGALLNAMWAENGRYVDPMADVTGPESVSKMIGNFRFIFPGAKVKSTSGIVQGEDGWVTFDWVIVSRMGRRTLFTGFDVAHLNAEGKIEFLAGFFGTRYPQ